MIRIFQFIIPRMKLAMHRLQSAAIDVRVVLRRADVGVPEQLLHRARSAPPASRCVAKLCRSVCGLTFPFKPARRAYFFTRIHSISRVSRLPPLLTNSHGLSLSA